MAFFTDTINNQIATQLSVADQIARQKQMEIENAMKIYSLGKAYGDNKLEGLGTRGMMNQGMIPGLFTQGMDGLRGLAQKAGADVKGVERHAHNVDATLTNDILPDLGEGLTPEQLEENVRNRELASMSNEDRVRKAAYQTYKSLYPDMTEEAMEEIFSNEYFDSQGRMINPNSLSEDIRGTYIANEKALREKQTEAKAFKAHTDEQKELRDIVKKHGIDKLKEFSGSHSNMRNQNKKIHKALIDYYVSKKNWDKAQELNDAYIQNEKNIDKHWGMGGKREYESLFKRPTGPKAAKKDFYNIIIPGRTGDHTAAFTQDEINDPDKVFAVLSKIHPDLKREDLAGYTANIADKKDRADNPYDRDNRIKDEIAAAEEKWRKTRWGSGGNDGKYNRDNWRTANVFFVDGQPVHRSRMSEADMDRVAIDILNPKRGEQLNVARLNEIKRFIVGH